MLIFGTNLEIVNDTKSFLSSNFDMKDMGEVDVILGIKITRDSDRIMLSQGHYIEKILKDLVILTALLFLHLMMAAFT